MQHQTEKSLVREKNPITFLLCHDNFLLQSQGMPTHSRASTTESSHFFQEASLLDEREISDVDAARNENEIMRKINQRWLHKLERETLEMLNNYPFLWVFTSIRKLQKKSVDLLLQCKVYTQIDKTSIGSFCHNSFLLSAHPALLLTKVAQALEC